MKLRIGIKDETKDRYKGMKLRIGIKNETKDRYKE